MGKSTEKYQLITLEQWNSRGPSYRNNLFLEAQRELGNRNPLLNYTTEEKVREEYNVYQKERRKIRAGKLKQDPNDRNVESCAVKTPVIVDNIGNSIMNNVLELQGKLVESREESIKLRTVLEDIKKIHISEIISLNRKEEELNKEIDKLRSELERTRFSLIVEREYHSKTKLLLSYHQDHEHTETV